VAETRPSVLTCPLCGSAEGSEVIDSRGTADGQSIRRRRLCCACGDRFTTYELPLDPDVLADQRARAKVIAEQLREMAQALEIW
jgi:transcriptional regulator NrdR family protein